jgi:hypothetical protein
MGIITLLILILAVVGGVTLAVTIGPVIGSALSATNREAKRQLREAQTRERIATSALRAIANGDSMPVLTAGDALDRIESNYTKELN